MASKNDETPFTYAMEDDSEIDDYLSKNSFEEVSHRANQPASQVEARESIKTESQVYQSDAYSSQV